MQGILFACEDEGLEFVTFRTEEKAHGANTIVMRSMRVHELTCQTLLRL